MRKTAKFTTKYLNQLIEEATTDAYNESEQAGGFFAMIEEDLSLPFVTMVLEQEVTVVKVDITRRDQIVAMCMHGKATQVIPILDLPMIAKNLRIPVREQEQIASAFRLAE